MFVNVGDKELPAWRNADWITDIWQNEESPEQVWILDFGDDLVEAHVIPFDTPVEAANWIADTVAILNGQPKPQPYPPAVSLTGHLPNGNEVEAAAKVAFGDVYSLGDEAFQEATRRHAVNWFLAWRKVFELRG